MFAHVILVFFPLWQKGGHTTLRFTRVLQRCNAKLQNVLILAVPLDYFVDDKNVVTHYKST